MSAPWTEWDHIVKIDPDKSLPEGETFGDVCATGTDAVEIGGTTGITEEKLARVIDACAEHDVALYQEPNEPSIVVDDPALDGYLVPSVFNAGDPFWITGAHAEWMRSAEDHDWERTSTEAYIVLNPDSAVGTVTQADCDLDADEVAGYASIAEELFGQEIVYVEYSGTFGDPEIVEAAADPLEETTLFYGGGIHDYESARTMAEHADAVVVGNLAHEEGADAVQATVDGAKDA